MARRAFVTYRLHLLLIVSSFEPSAEILCIFVTVVINKFRKKTSGDIHLISRRFSRKFICVGFARAVARADRHGQFTEFTRYDRGGGGVFESAAGVSTTSIMFYIFSVPEIRM